MGGGASQEGLRGDQLLRSGPDGLLVASEAGETGGDQLRGVPHQAGQSGQRSEQRQSRRAGVAGAAGSVCGGQREGLFGGTRADCGAGAEAGPSPAARPVASQAAEFRGPGPDAVAGPGVSSGQQLVAGLPLGEVARAMARLAGEPIGGVPPTY